ncbi:MAG: SLC13 family permease [Candidatus Heimdallarchaeaceae archaeon]
MDKKKMFEKGIIIAVIIVTVILTGIFAKKTAEPGVYNATLTVEYADHTKEITFQFNLSSTEQYPLFEYKEPFFDDYEIWYKYAPVIKIAYSQKILVEVAVVQNNVTANPVPRLENFALKIEGKSLDQHLPVIEETVDYKHITWFVFQLHLPYRTNIVLSLLFGVGILWVTEIIPLAATSLLIPVIGAVLVNLSSRTVLAPFADPVIYLFFGGFVIAKAMNKTGLDKWISLNIVRVSPNNPKILMLILMILAAFLSMFMSNTATAATLVPLGVAVGDKLKTKDPETNKQIEKYTKALILGIAYSASIGGIGSAIGTPANPIAIALLNEYAGANITFAKWFLFGLPVVLIMLPLMWIYLWAVYRPKVPSENMQLAKNAVSKELENIGPLNWKQIYVLFVFVLALTLWLTEKLHGISSSIVALIAGLMMFIPKLLVDKDINDINWSALIIFGGGLALGVIMTETGASDLIAYSITNLEITNTFVIVILVGVLSVLLTFVASNTGTAAIMVPLVIPLALFLRIDPVLLAVVAAIGASIDTCLPTGTPPTLIAYSTEKYKVSEMVKIGGLVMIFGTLLLIFVMPFFWRLINIVYF